MFTPKNLIPLILAAGFISTTAYGQTTKASADEQKAARAEIEQLSKRIQELSKKLGPDDQMQITIIETKRDSETGMVERSVTTTAPAGKGPGRIEDKRGGKRIEMYPAGPRIGLGVVMAPNSGNGVKIAAVSPKGPAKDAGLQAGDVITAINGKAISAKDQAGVDQARAALSNLKEGQTVKLAYTRNGKSANATLKAGKIEPQMIVNRETRGPMPGGAPHAFAFATRWSGMNLAELNPQLGRYFGSNTGVLVLSPKAEFPQLQAGDVILKINGKPVAKSRDVLEAMHGKNEGEKVAIDILRDRKAQSVSISAPKMGPMEPPMPPMPPMPPGPPRVAMLFDGAEGGLLTEDLIGGGDRFRTITLVGPAMDEDVEIEIIESEIGDPR
ncbi:PDZ domain-containing protein [Arenimonas sp. GDDSR-1]|uniref:PDZ domain-containing protein n=1 Tax=Arenimonas sp. GDDSR-1 TaxID=2950125 RepID=UPI0026308E5F|nr:PDZ domain-containing protein [Arenimonas sp. GDDSR-1]